MRYFRNSLTSIPAALLLANAVTTSVAVAQVPRLAPCPVQSDTLSLLQPSDSAYGDAPAVSQFLQQHGLVVRCVTRSTAAGLLGLERVAGFQTDRGTITVFFLPDTEQVRVVETRTSRGFRYTFVKSGPRPARTVVNTDGRAYYLVRGTWFMEVWDAELATQLRHMTAQR